jgi:serine/threonine-protein kinase
MHARGLLHRDVKPSNIGLAADGTPKLLDFGLAHLVEESQLDLRNACDGLDAREDSDLAKTLTGHVVGTPLYLSPEALAGALPSPAQDLWSLHLVLWESIAGRHPCAGKSLPMALRSLARGSIPDIRTVQPDCPSAIAELLVRGLSSDPRLRPPTANAVRDSLMSVADAA